MVGCSGCGNAWNKCSCRCPHGRTFGEHSCGELLVEAEELLEEIWRKDPDKAIRAVRGEVGKS